MKRLIFFILPFLLFISCSTQADYEDSEDTITLTIKNDRQASYYIFAQINGRDSSTYIGFINQMEDKEFYFDSSTVINSIDFYSDTDTTTMTLQDSYSEDIFYNTTLLIEDQAVSCGE